MHTETPDPARETLTLLVVPTGARAPWRKLEVAALLAPAAGHSTSRPPADLAKTDDPREVELRAMIAGELSAAAGTVSATPGDGPTATRPR